MNRKLRAGVRPFHAGVVWLAVVVALMGGRLPELPAYAAAAQHPNILWITCEDTSPWLGFCGESYARTPNLDRLAREGVHYTRAFASAPVCSPARFCIITGVYATAMGTQGLRSRFPVPDDVKGFPGYLRAAGYYCTNNVKTDYNTSAEPRIISESWDECSAKAHWRNRKPGQPFFAVFNLTETHQGPTNVAAHAEFERRIASRLSPAERHDPAKAPIPPYYPDTPVVRRTMARVHDCITAMDRRVGELLSELETSGLAADTIVFFYPDHGQGIPRGKRTLYDTGLQVPLVVRFPEKYGQLAPAEPGRKCDRLVSFVDLAPTVLSLVGLPIPSYMQGVPFLGAAAGAPRQYVYGARDRVDEALEVSRSARDARYLYVRNYMPDQSWNQPEWYSDQSELRREITRLAAKGKLNEAQLTYAGPRKPPEELFDTERDPWQLHNVAGDPHYAPVLDRMRQALRRWQVAHRDLGLIPEWEAWEMCRAGRPLCEAARCEEDYPLERVLDTAEMVGRPHMTARQAQCLSDPDPVVRYWATIGLRVSGPQAAVARESLRQALNDRSAPVRIEAAGILVAIDRDRDALDLLAGTLGSGDQWAVLHAARTLQLLGENARPVLPAMKQFLATPRGKGEPYGRWSVETAVGSLEPAQDAQE